MPLRPRPANTDAKPSEPSTPSDRFDAWQNYVTGLGTMRDKSSGMQFIPEMPLPDGFLSSLYNSDFFAQKIIGFKPREMFRKGYSLQIPETDPKIVKALACAADEMKLNAALLRGLKWGRLFGGAILYFSVDDGGLPGDPLNLKKLKRLNGIYVIDRRFLQSPPMIAANAMHYADEPEYYTVSGSSERIHKSRVIRFEGADVEDRRRMELGSWGHSHLQLVIEALKRYVSSQQAGAALVSDAQQAVFKLKGLWKAIGTNNKEALQERMMMVDRGRSATRAILLDSEGEDFERKPTNFTGLPEVMEMFMSEISAVAEIPQTLLFGRSPAGMNATGNSDFQAFYDQVGTAQTNDLLPILRRAFTIIGAAFGIDADDLVIKFNPLKEMTDKERAEIRKLVADADAIEIGQGVLQPEEVAIARYGSGDYQPFASPVIDVEKLQADLEADTEFEDPNDEEIKPEDPEETDPGNEIESESSASEDKAS